MDALAARSIRASSAHILVDRNDELALLDRLACQTLAGRAQVVTVEGLAGAGKTALVTEALRRSMPDAVVLHGRGGGAHAAPHLPLAMAMRSFGEGEAVARLLDGVVAESAAAPAEAGVADMVVDCLARGARQRRLAVVLEDLDRSDPATLGLVAYVGSRLADDSEERAHLLLLCTFRPGPRGGIDAAMRRLVALPSVTHLPLHPLSEPGVLQMLTDLLGAKPSRALLREAVRTSRGIPGRIHQLVTALVEVDGLVDRVGEVDLGVASVVLPLPRDDVRRAEATLTAMETVHRQLVITAALMGAGRQLEDLRAALRSDADTFEAGLEAAFAAGCLIDRDDRIAFCDPSFAEAVLHGIRPRQQRRLHAAIAANLAAAGAATTPGRIMLLAHHLAVAGPSEPRYRDLFEIGRAAGSLAMANGDYSSAARYFEAALSAENGRASTAMVALLHLEAGIARFRDHDPTAALAHLRLAADGARSGGEPEVWGRAVLALSTMLTVNSNQSVGHDVGLELIREFLDARPAVDPGVRARVLQRLSQAQFASFAFDAALTTAEQAAAAAADSSDPTLLGDIGFARGLALLGTLQLGSAEAALRGSVGHAVAAGDRWIEASALGRLPFVTWMRGDLTGAESSVQQALTLARSTRNWSEWSLAAATAAGISLARGELGEVERHGSEAELLYRRSESGFTTVVLYPALACARTLRGDASSAHQALDAWAAAGVFGSEFFRLLVDAFDGVRQSGHELHGVVPAEESLLGLTLAALSVELGDLIDDEDLIAQGLPPLASALRQGVVWCPGWSFFLPRLVAVAAWRLGRDDPAALFERACAIAARTRAVAELARTRSDAAACCAATDPERAATLAAKARLTFAESGMMALLRRWRDSETSGWTRPRPSLALPERTFFFSDVVDSTGMTHRLGIERYSTDWLAAHDNIVRGCLREANGNEFKHTGDGIAAWFSSELDAMSCSLEVQRRLAHFNVHHLGEPLRVRIGLSYGEVVIDSADQPQGLALIRARRLCDLAHADQVVVSDEVARRVRSDRFRFQPIGEVVLKGFTEPEVVHLATPSSSDGA